MTHASLFSGIGGFDLAAEWVGWDNIFHCEWNPFGQRVLAHHFPNSKSYNDITKTDFSIHAGEIDVLTGGFPCQPYSQAGKRLGKADERHLFPHMLRCVKEVKPKWVIGENVRGLVSWNGGLVFHEVCNDLEREGYEVQPFLIPAAGVNAPHQRQRIWFVAYRKDFGCKSTKTIDKWKEHIQNDRNGIRTISKSDGEVRNVTNTNNNGHTIDKTKIREKNGISRINREEICSRESNGTSTIQWDDANSNSFGQQRWQEGEFAKNRTQSNDKQFERCSKLYRGDFEMFPSESPICGGDDGLPKELDGITFPKWRNESIKAYGNAIVPQVAYEIFKAIQSFDDLVNV
jgi:DNA (cytosine-5)-methyltransferase 1